MNAFLRKLTWLANRRRREAELREEIEFHLDQEFEDRKALGLTGDDAQSAARRDLGNLTRLVEDTRASWGWPRLEQTAQDIRYAVRMLRRTPGLAAITVGSSALGIGACTVIFAVINFALLTPLPVDEPDQLMSISEVNRRTGIAGSELSYLDFLDLRQARSFEGVAAVDPMVPASIGLSGDPQRHWGSLATANYFDVVRPAFALGRGFDSSRDDVRGAPPVVVLGHLLWQRSFGSDPHIVGRSVSINNRPATIVGVTAAGFAGTAVGSVPEFWIPFSMVDEIEFRSGPVTQNRRRYWLEAVARLRPGIDVQNARAELEVIALNLNTMHGRGHERSFHLEPAGLIDPELRHQASTVLAVSSFVTILVLLTACSNVANLLLGRASARRQEIAARMALGASRLRLVRQLLTESLLLALIGGGGGWIIAGYVSALLSAQRIPLGWPLDLSISPGYRVLLFCIGVSIVTGIAFGLAPALRATRPDLITELKAGPRGGRTLRRLGLRNGLVVLQVAICTVLLLSMGLFLRSLQSARAIDLGFANRDLLMLSIDPALGRRPDAHSRALLRDLLERSRMVAGVESATLTTAVPLTFIISNSNFVSERRTDSTPRVRADIYQVGPDYFATLAMPLLAGQDFRPDAAATGTAIVNEAFARAAFPQQSPIGQRVLGDGRNVMIVGVVSTAKSRTIAEAARPVIYLPILAEYSAQDTPRGVTLIVKAKDGTGTAVQLLRDAIRSADPSLAVFDVRPMERHIEDASIVPRVTWALSAVAGVVGLVLATIGIYGAVSFAVARRRRELGIRLAVGARPREVLRLTLRQGIGLGLAGTAIGVLAGAGITRFVASLLYGVGPLDAATFITVPACLLAVVLIASLVPARQAARLDPVDVLRSE